MSFTTRNKPRIGEVSRCARCARTWIATSCNCGDVARCGSMLVSPMHPVVNIETDIAARLVADRVSLFCPRCWTEDEKLHILLKQRAEDLGQAGN